jgi:hypothetical protein
MKLAIGVLRNHGGGIHPLLTTAYCTYSEKEEEGVHTSNKFILNAYKRFEMLQQESE